jgi:Cof subfamily protein (haloacid dehalogenase superfamily)
MRYRLLALDVDGTLLDPAGKLRPVVQQAIMEVQQRGIRVVLCTGRRFRTALPLAQELQLTAPLVVHNGALVKDPASGDTLHQTCLPARIYLQALLHLRQLGVPMVYIDAFHDHIDILTEALERAHPFQQAYLQENLTHCRIVEDIGVPPAYGVVMMSVMGDETSLQALRSRITAALRTQARINMLINKNYQGFILEVLHPAVSKWVGLQRLAAQEGIAPEAIMAVGDDENDMEMLRGAGLGIAMGNARPEVKAAADQVTSSNADDGLVQAIERFLLR